MVEHKFMVSSCDVLYGMTTIVVGKGMHNNYHMCLFSCSIKLYIIRDKPS
jgi:hypothetical protein